MSFDHFIYLLSQRIPLNGPISDALQDVYQQIIDPNILPTARDIDLFLFHLKQACTWINDDTCIIISECIYNSFVCV